MKIIKQESINTVIHAWLKGEWVSLGYSQKYPELKAKLIDHPNFNSSAQNKKRRELLRETRQRNIDELPADIKWFSAKFEDTDYPLTYLIACDDWLPISNNSYKLESTTTNFDLPLPHTSYIQEIYKTLPNPSIDPKLIMVGSSLGAPVTIIEGNHRAVAFVKYSSKNPDSPKLLNEIYLGLSVDMKDYVWHIESRDIANPARLRQVLKKVNV